MRRRKKLIMLLKPESLANVQWKERGRLPFFTCSASFGLAWLFHPFLISRAALMSFTMVPFRLRRALSRVFWRKHVDEDEVGVFPTA